VLLWADAPHAAALSYAVLPFELTFWIGFASPWTPPRLARTVLVALASPSTGRVHPERY
jgi:hypothetical protein